MNFSSLSGLVSWGQLLPRLNLTVSALALPAVTVCPVCRAKQLYIVQDPVFAGEWSYCAGCEFHGDMIELAARAWKLDLPAAIDRLRQLGFELAPLETSAYLTKVVQPRVVIEKFWRDSQALMDQRLPAINALATDWGCCPHWHTDWARTGRRIVAATTRERFNEVARELGFARLPRDPAYHLLLLHPYYDAPGRISGFQILGRGANFCANTKAVDPDTDRRKPYGLTMFDTVLRPAPKQLFGDVFIGEWETAFQLQIKHLRTSLQFLPLLAPMSWSSPQPGLHLLGRRQVRVMPDRDRPSTAMTIFTKRYHGGLVRFGHGGIGDKTYSKRSPLEWLQTAQQRTQGWHSSVLDALADYAPAAATTFLTELRLTKREQDELLHRADGPVRAKLAEALPLIDAPSEVTVASLRIRETAVGWSHVSRRAPITILTGIIRCDYIIEAGEHTRVTGRLLRAAGPAPFTLSERVIRRDGLFFALRDHLRTRGIEFDFLSQYNQRSWSIATAFHQPKVVHGCTSLGWDDVRNRFYLPSCTILADGKVEAPATILVDDDYPGRLLAAPGFLINRYAAYLSSAGPCVSTIWALALVTLRTLLSPVLRLEDRSVALTGPGCTTHGNWIAQQLGCTRDVLPTNTPTTATYQQFAKRIARHGWPVYLTAADGARPSVWIGSGRGHSLLAMPPEHALFAAVRGWDVIHAKLFEIPELAKDCIRHIIPNYLQNVCKRRLPLPPNADLTELLVDVSDWWLAATGHTLHPHLVRKCFPYCEVAPADVFRQAVQHVALPVDDKQSAVLISQRALTAATKLHNLPPLNYPRITQALQAAGVLLDLHDSADDYRWAVRPDWWHDRCTEATEATD